MLKKIYYLDHVKFTIYFHILPREESRMTQSKSSSIHMFNAINLHLL